MLTRKVKIQRQLRLQQQATGKQNRETVMYINISNKPNQLEQLSDRPKKFHTEDSESTRVIDYCHFYLGHAASEHSCGQRRDATDIPRLFVIRYLRNSSAVDSRTEEKTKWKSLLVQDLINDSDQAGQFVAGYKGADDVSQITHWLANITADGDSRDLPFFTLRTPNLVPDDAEPIWSKTVQSIPLKNLKQSILGGISGLSVYLEDPRVGPFLLLGALISLGTIWLRRSQQVQPSESNQPSQPTSKTPSQDERKQKPRDRVRSRSNKKAPPSMTDLEPSDAYQMPLSDSESE
ncbi:hypothetical protein CR513_47560, partial [Mucuna pruriens]